jgi:hypothetical protein
MDLGAYSEARRATVRLPADSYGIMHDIRRIHMPHLGRLLLVSGDKNMGYIDTLIKNCHTAKAACPSRTFEVNDLSELDGVRTAIYIIEEIGGNPEDTFLALSRYKENKERACTKLNAPSKVLYVGSSTTGVRERIEQHIGKGNKGTYALHLSHWFEGKYKVTVKQYDVTNEVLQIIEDNFSDSLKPAFGKQGGNNK